VHGVWLRLASKGGCVCFAFGWAQRIRERACMAFGWAFHDGRRMYMSCGWAWHEGEGACMH